MNGVKSLFGYTGSLLRVNLTEKKVKVETLSESTARKYLGGRGLGLKILFDELETGIDPLGPENKLLFLTGPIAGTFFPGNSRYCVMAKSPLTGCQGEAHAGGFFAARMKFAGFDAIIVEGVSPSPVYISVCDGQCEIKSAEHIWGKTTHETESAVKKEEGDPKISVASIGLGGENLVRFACIINDVNRAAGRTGMGAVMGSKKLKAVTVSGESRVVVAEKAKLMQLSRTIIKRLLNDEAVKNFVKHGTAYGAPFLNELGGLPTKNFAKGYFKHAEDIGGEAMTRTILRGTQACYGCPFKCIRITEVKSGPYKGDFGDGPEYEAVASLGSLCLNNNLEAIAYGNHLCNLHSIDVISTGVCIAFAIECYEKGLITKRETNGIELLWGNHSAIIKLIEMIAKRQGFGNLLAEGVRRAAEVIGLDSRSFAMEVKGLEVPMHEARGKLGLGLSYATANRGAVHTDAAHDTAWEGDRKMPEIGLYGPMSRFTTKGKSKLIRKMRDVRAVQNSIIICSYVGNPAYRPVSLQELVYLINYTTGWDLTVEEFMLIGDRISNLGRAFNVREGITKSDDILPKRLSEPLPDGFCRGEKISEKDLNGMLNEFYTLSNWSTKTGRPKADKLKELGLSHIADQLRSLGLYKEL